MSFVDICAGWSRHALHGVITGLEEGGGQDVDDNMDARCPSTGQSAIPIVQFSAKETMRVGALGIADANGNER